MSATAYREAVLKFAEMRTMEVWYSHVAVQELLDSMDASRRSLKGADKTQAKTTEKNAKKLIEKARTRDSLQALSKLAEHVDGRYRIISQPPMVIPHARPAGDLRLLGPTARGHHPGPVPLLPRDAP